jgi:hypothetical protein
MIILENDYLSISFDKKAGWITSLVDKQKGIEFIPQGKASDPFRVEFEEETTNIFQKFSYAIDQQGLNGNGLRFTWELSEQVKLVGTILLASDSNELTFGCELINHSEQSVISIEYPIIPNICSITEQGQEDYLAHSFATGFRIHNPLAHFTKEFPGFRFMPYPEGFSGATMQFFSYYGIDTGGLYFATYDGDSYSKWLNFYKNEHDLLEASFIHGNEDIGPKKGIKVSYPIVVRTLQGHDWYESADIYKKWATNQYWCQKGVLSDPTNSNKCNWLIEDIGLSTFGINAGADRSEWINKYHDEIKTKTFHILGPDWPQKTQDFRNQVPGGLNDWFPTRFNESTLNSIKQNGDKYAPFEFDYLFNVNGADGERGKFAMQKIPKDPTKSIDQYPFPFVCPADLFVQELHIRRDETLQKENNVDSIYYDISANNIIKVCMDENHGHTKGAGRQITMAYRQNYLNTKEAMIKQANGQYIPMGTEMINEVFLDVLDYYQARAGGQPAAPLEGWNIRELLKSGEAELIPMFTYVYHEYGAVRLDGWGKVVEEIGDLFYFTVARTYLWGGLYELNYEYSPKEVINGKENSPEEHYYPFEPRGYEFSSNRAKYISKFANLRTGVGNKYLSYGKMLKPLQFKTKKINMKWFHYNCAKQVMEYNNSGELLVDSIIHSAWQYRDESVGLFFANVSDEQHQFKINLDIGQYFPFPAEVKVQIISENKTNKMFTMNSNEARLIDLTVPVKSYIMIEIVNEWVEG